MKKKEDKKMGKKTMPQMKDKKVMGIKEKEGKVKK
jgi:hypothetical protein